MAIDDHVEKSDKLRIVDFIEKNLSLILNKEEDSTVRETALDELVTFIGQIVRKA